MARVIERDEELLLVLTPLEQFGSFHRIIRAPKNSLILTKEMADPWSRVEGMSGVRAPGTGIPGVIMLGTLRRKKAKDFVAVYGRGSATVFEFQGQPFERWILSLPRE
jgi:hypothetical protein